MTLRAEIEALLVEFDHFAYQGAPLEVAVEKLQEILARTETRVLTTLEKLDSEDAFEALCVMPSEGPVRVAAFRTNGENAWWTEHTSAELLAHFASIGADPAFTVIEG